MADIRSGDRSPSGLHEPSPELVRLRSIAVSVYGPTILVAVGQGAILPLVALSARELGASVGTAALIVALIGLGQLIGDLPAGALAARIGERRALIAACVVDAMALLGAFLAQSLILLAVAITVTGLAHAVFGLARHAYLTERHPGTVPGPRSVHPGRQLSDRAVHRTIHRCRSSSRDGASALRTGSRPS